MHAWFNALRTVRKLSHDSHRDLISLTGGCIPLDLCLVFRCIKLYTIAVLSDNMVVNSIKKTTCPYMYTMGQNVRHVMSK